MAIDLFSSRFRANPAYELVPANHLTTQERAELRALGVDDDYAALLRSRELPMQRLKAICQQTADLYGALIEPRALPDDLRPLLGDRFTPTIAQLVLDGILEVEHDGQFVSGPAAQSLLLAESESLNGGYLAKLSIRALQYADALDIVDNLRLCGRLYFFNRIPASADLARRLPDAAAVEHFLRLSIDGRVKRLLDRAWSRRDRDQQAGWISWQALRPRSIDTRSNGSMRSATLPTYKLYVSPAIDDLPEAFAATLHVLSACGAASFKVGRDLHGLLRPDKLVAYFASHDHLREAIDPLARMLQGCRAQGVPFTADAGGDGLLSWGIDPPAPTNGTGNDARSESWRAWVTSRLAAALLSAKATGSGAMAPWRFALERVRLDGVDTDTWTPSSSIWIDDALIALGD
jgi:hypothetical protein